MSHFTVLVTNVNINGLDKQLAPFDEELELPKHIVKTKAQLIKDAQETKQRAEELASKGEGDREWVKEYLEAKTDEDLYRLAKEDYPDSEFNENGDLLETWNENAKWDWWIEGGRWDGYLIRKNGEECNRCLVKELDFEKMLSLRKERLEEHYEMVIRGAKEEKREPLFWGYDHLPSKEEFCAIKDEAPTYAILHNGEWYEKGEMGWWGIDTPKFTEEEWAKKWFEIFNSLDPESEVVLVDCHI